MMACGFLLCVIGVIPAWVIAEYTMREISVECNTCGKQR